MNTVTIKQLDEFNFYSTMEKSKGIAFVFFSGPHCSSCHHLKRVMEIAYPQFKSYFIKQNLAFEAYEIKAEQATSLVNQFNVFHLPTMFLYLNGEYHCELQSEAIAKKLIEAMDTALEKDAEEEP